MFFFFHKTLTTFWQSGRISFVYTAITWVLMNLESWNWSHFEVDISGILTTPKKSWFDHFFSLKIIENKNAFFSQNSHNILAIWPNLFRLHSHNLIFNELRKLKLISFQSRHLKNSNDTKKVLIRPFLQPQNNGK